MKRASRKVGRSNGSTRGRQSPSSVGRFNQLARPQADPCERKYIYSIIHLLLDCTVMLAKLVIHPDGRPRHWFKFSPPSPSKRQRSFAGTQAPQIADNDGDDKLIGIELAGLGSGAPNRSEAKPLAGVESGRIRRHLLFDCDLIKIFILVRRRPVRREGVRQTTVGDLLIETERKTHKVYIDIMQCS